LPFWDKDESVFFLQLDNNDIDLIRNNWMLIVLKTVSAITKDRKKKNLHI